MQKVFVALYDNSQNARRAVQDLLDAGLDRNALSVVSREGSEHYAGRTGPVELQGDEDINRIGTNALFGGITGMVVGLFALAIPGIGPVIAAGPIAAAVVGAGAGAVTGGLVGALVELGVEEDSAGYYAEGVRRGGTLVSVETPVAMQGRVSDILKQHNPVDLERRVATWREEGWEHFNSEADPYSY